MKANKALRRLSKIEALMLDVTERYSSSAPRIRELLQDAKAAVARAMEAVGLQASSGTGRSQPVKRSKAASKAKPEATKAKRKVRAAGKEAKAKAPTVKAAKVSAPAKKGPAKVAAKKATPAAATATMAAAATQSGSPQFWSELDGREK